MCIHGFSNSSTASLVNWCALLFEKRKENLARKYHNDIWICRKFRTISWLLRYFYEKKKKRMSNVFCCRWAKPAQRRHSSECDKIFSSYYDVPLHRQLPGKHLIFVIRFFSSATKCSFFFKWHNYWRKFCFYIIISLDAINEKVRK